MVDSSDKMEPEDKLEVPHRRDRRKNRQVCLHQSVAKFACDFRWERREGREIPSRVTHARLVLVSARLQKRKKKS